MTSSWVVEETDHDWGTGAEDMIKMAYPLFKDEQDLKPGGCHSRCWKRAFQKRKQDVRGGRRGEVPQVSVAGTA